MTTKTQLITEYEKLLKATYPWTQDAARFERFMASVKLTLAPGAAITWNRDSEAFRAACHNVGISPRLSLKALKALPE